MNDRVPMPADGVIVPMVTPLRPGGTVDAESAASLCDYLIGAGVDGLLVLGSTGENSALSREERRRAVSAVVASAAGRVHVMAGVPSLGTPDAVADAIEYAALGADSLLLPAPSGFELSQDELGDHFRAVAAAAELPLSAYQVPSRVHVNLADDLLVTLAKEGVISGIKDSSGNLGAARARSQRLRAEGLRLGHFTGSEECIDGFLLGGGTGCVPGLANVVPHLHVALARHAAAGEWEAASAVQARLIPILAIYFRAVPGGSFSSQVFAGLKEALVQLGVIATNTTSAPLRQADSALGDHIRDVLATVAAAA